MRRTLFDRFESLAALTLIGGVLFLGGCGCTPDPQNAAQLKTYRKSSVDGSPSQFKNPQDLRAVRVYVHHDGRWRELDPGDLVKLEYITADGLPLDPPGLTFSVGGPDAPKIEKEK